MYSVDERLGARQRLQEFQVVLLDEGLEMAFRVLRMFAVKGFIQNLARLAEIFAEAFRRERLQTEQAAHVVVRLHQEIKTVDKCAVPIEENGRGPFKLHAAILA